MFLRSYARVWVSVSFFRLDYFIFLKNIRKMKPPRKPEEEENDSGSDTESEDEEDEDTVF